MPEEIRQTIARHRTLAGLQRHEHQQGKLLLGPEPKLLSVRSQELDDAEQSEMGCGHHYLPIVRPTMYYPRFNKTSTRCATTAYAMENGRLVVSLMHEIDR
jgi:hypothetical protein